jgi:TRAP-type C4-dicarboxylate transport system permease small subunit
MHSEPGGDDHQAQFVEDMKRRLSSYRLEDVPAFFAFWALAVVVFLEVFTRYVLNDSIAWTEETARYLLICVAFLGAPMAVRKNSQIFVRYFYRFIPFRLQRILSTVVDLGNIIFLCIIAYLTYKIIITIRQRMAALDLPMSVLYWVVLAGIIIMIVRAIQLAWRHFRSGASGLYQRQGEESDT